MNRKRGEGGRFDPMPGDIKKENCIKQEHIDNDQQTVTFSVCINIYNIDYHLWWRGYVCVGHRELQTS